MDCKRGAKSIVQHRRYLPDFLITPKGFYIEVKGKLDSKARSKMRDVKRCNPDLDIRMLLLSDNKLTPRKPERYSDWCRKFGYTFAIKKLPLDWFK